MGIVHDFELHKYGLTSEKKAGRGFPKKNPSYCGVTVKHGDGISDAIKGAVGLAMQNKDLIKSVGQSVGSVAGAIGKMSDAAKRFNELKEIQRRLAMRPQQPKSGTLPPEVKQAIQNIPRNKSGDGFQKF